MADGQNLDGSRGLQNPIDDTVVADDQFPKAVRGEFRHGSSGFRKFFKPRGLGLDRSGELTRGGRIVGLKVSNKIEEAVEGRPRPDDRGPLRHR